MPQSVGVISFSVIFLVFLIDSVESQQAKCRYRNDGEFPEPIFSVYAAFGCYKYTQKSVFINDEIFENITACTVDGYRVPGVIIDGECLRFQHNNTKIQDLVRRTFVAETYFDRWIDCCEDAVACCGKISSNISKDDAGGCPAVWDGWSCFDTAPLGTVVEHPCPIFAYSGQGPQCTHYSQKKCFSNGTWSAQTNYATCAINQRLITRTQWHMTILGISIAVCIPALLILFLCRSLQGLKFNLIRDLILAIVVRSILVILSKRLVILDELVNEENTVISQNGVACRVLAFFEKLASNAVFTCMLLEAIYLHHILTNVFLRGKNERAFNILLFYAGGGTISLIAALSWALAMALANDRYCWVVSDGTEFQWINDTPRLLMLTINFGLLLHIIIYLRRMLKYNPVMGHTYVRRTAKVSMICLPLFGVPFLFIAIRPSTESCSWEQSYYFISYAMEGLQGISVAILHCYTNREVRCTIRNTWFKFREYLPGNFKKRSSISTTRDSEPTDTGTTFTGDTNVKSSPVIAMTTLGHTSSFPKKKKKKSLCCKQNRTDSVDTTTSTWNYRDDVGFENFDVFPQKQEQLPVLTECTLSSSAEVGSRENRKGDSAV
ncbi:hypothetical protein DMENIID0001_014560 [Sergentomyia squamirostris]